MAEQLRAHILLANTYAMLEDYTHQVGRRTYGTHDTYAMLEDYTRPVLACHGRYVCGARRLETRLVLKDHSTPVLTSHGARMRCAKLHEDGLHVPCLVAVANNEKPLGCYRLFARNGFCQACGVPR